jgi:hypothetical protein
MVSLSVFNIMIALELQRREALEQSLVENEELHTSLTLMEEEKSRLEEERDSLRYSPFNPLLFPSFLIDSSLAIYPSPWSHLEMEPLLNLYSHAAYLLSHPSGLLKNPSFF